MLEKARVKSFLKNTTVGAFGSRSTTCRRPVNIRGCVYRVPVSETCHYRPPPGAPTVLPEFGFRKLVHECYSYFVRVEIRKCVLSDKGSNSVGWVSPFIDRYSWRILQTKKNIVTFSEACVRCALLEKDNEEKKTKSNHPPIPP